MYDRPSIPQLMTRSQQDIRAELQDSDPALRRTMLRALSNSQVGLSHGQYGAIQYTSKQVTVLYCDLDTLADFGRLYQTPQKASTPAVGNAVITGVDHTDIPAGTELMTGDGQLYTTDVDCTPAGGTVTVAITAETAGAAANQDAGAVLTFTAPIGGINAVAAVDGSGLSGGTDIESTDAWRVRIQNRIGNPPGRWLPQDYVDLAEAQPGVTRAWAYPNELALGMMTVRFVVDDGTGTASIIPSGAQVTAMQAVFNAQTPTWGPAIAVAPIADVTAFTLHGIPLAYQAAVEASLAVVFSQNNIPGGIMPQVLLVNAVETVVPTNTDWNMVLPAADLAPITGHIPTLGVVTFT